MNEVGFNLLNATDVDTLPCIVLEAASWRAGICVNEVLGVESSVNVSYVCLHGENMVK